MNKYLLSSRKVNEITFSEISAPQTNVTAKESFYYPEGNREGKLLYDSPYIS